MESIFWFELYVAVCLAFAAIAVGLERWTRRSKYKPVFTASEIVEQPAGTVIVSVGTVGTGGGGGSAYTGPAQP